MTRIRVGVLRGGPSNEHDVSLKTGRAVLDALSHHTSERYEPIEIFIDKKGEWHIGGAPIAPHKALQHADVFVNALHGAYGEDGQVQNLFSSFKTPHTGSTALGAALSMQKPLAKKVLEQAGIMTPRSRLVRVGDSLTKDLMEAFRSLPNPTIVKPASSGSSLGVSRVRSFDEMRDAVGKAFEHAPEVLIEEYIPGREVVCGIVEHFRGEPLYALLPIEVMPHDGAFFDFAHKYADTPHTAYTGRFSNDERDLIQNTARAVHTALGLRHYSRIDCILTPRGVYVLEANALPGLMPNAPMVQGLEAVGSSLPEFLDHIIGLAMGH